MKRLRPIHALLVALAGSLILAGCASDKEPKPKEPNKLTDFKQKATLNERWHFDLGGSESNALQPAVTFNAVYAANDKGDVFRLDPGTGKEVWHANSGFAITGGVGASGDLVIVGGSKGDVAAFDADGKLRWKAKVSSEVLSSPQATNGVVVVRSGDGRIAGLNASDGKRIWLYERTMPALIVRSHAGVEITHGAVIAGYAGGKLAVIGLPDGILRWEATVSVPRGNTELERISDITSNPVSDDQEVCAAAYQGNTACFELMQGNPIWSREISSDKGMSLAGEYVYVTNDDGVVLAMDKTTGSSQWKNDQLTLRRTSLPYPIGQYVAVGDFEGYVHLLKQDDGGIAARIRTDDSGIVVSPTELEGGLLVQTARGGLYALDIK